jgi:toxin ParE1/3/4
MRFKVRITLEVKQQIEAVSGYIAQDSTRNARNWRHNIRERIRSLGTMPEKYEIAYRADQVGRDIRRTFFGVYRILYTIDRDTIVVVSIRHGARKPLSLEELRRLE